ncbi:MAG: SIS domain-containing protein [Mariprofundaceae bacterium]
MSGGQLPDRWLESGRNVVRIEAQALHDVSQAIETDFARAVECILELQGRLIVVGMGKSGIIAKKIAATFASTGTPAFFVHAAEAQHGDLGMITRSDVLLALSHSGETSELLGLLPPIKRLGITFIAITGNKDSTLARHADMVLHVPVGREACPLNLAPTASTTAALALGDALAVVVLEQRGLRPEDFANFHPAGSLGKRLLRVGELMHSGQSLPLADIGTPLSEAIIIMSSGHMGIAGITENGHLTGCISDGDLRRILQAGRVDTHREVGEFMHRNPQLIGEDHLASEALRVMEEHKITALFVINEDGKTIGAIHMHDLLQAGIL